MNKALSITLKPSVKTWATLLCAKHGVGCWNLEWQSPALKARQAGLSPQVTNLPI